MFYYIGITLVFIACAVYTNTNETIVQRCVVIARHTKPSAIRLLFRWDYLQDCIEQQQDHTNSAGTLIITNNIAGLNTTDPGCTHLIYIGKKLQLTNFSLQFIERMYAPAISPFSYSYIQYYRRSSLGSVMKQF